MRREIICKIMLTLVYIMRRVIICKTMLILVYIMRCEITCKIMFILMIVFFYLLDLQIIYFNTFIIFFYMFRALLRSSSGGQIVLVQHLVWLPFLCDCSVHRLREDSVVS